MDPGNASPSSVYVIFFICLAAFGFIYFEIFRATEPRAVAPVVRSMPLK